ncbi:MAG: thiamine monophosphate synthase [Alphaproteobacteria bacterium PA2]|nr:MAG: thiamine monophosphate synthase [Alphaproteobacteria bacterium PA2]
MQRTAACLGRRGGGGKRLPPLLVFTDPARTPDVEALAAGLGRGTALVYRAFGAPDAEAVARRLLKMARRQGFLLLIGADFRLAGRIGAHGVHLPERLAHLAPALRRPGFRVTAAAHSARALRAKGVDAVVLSAIFPSASPSAGRPIGALKLAQMVRISASPVYALGGINDSTAPALTGTGVVGMAGVSFSRT